MNVLVAAPHPDDETLGCGGTLLKLIQQGATVHWLVFTSMRSEEGYSQASIQDRDAEMVQVAAAYKFAEVHRLGFPTTRLDTIPMRDLVNAVSVVVKRTAPATMFIPFVGDAHSDHLAAFRALSACTKSFNYSSLKRVFAYETISETDFGIDPNVSFRPNSFCDISDYLEEKIRIMSIYASEMNAFPFPRSDKAIRAQAMIRGVAAGYSAAEAFMVLKHHW